MGYDRGNTRMVHHNLKCIGRSTKRILSFHCGELEILAGIEVRGLIFNLTEFRSFSVGTRPKQIGVTRHTLIWPTLHVYRNLKRIKYTDRPVLFQLFKLRQRYFLCSTFFLSAVNFFFFCNLSVLMVQAPYLC